MAGVRKATYASLIPLTLLAAGCGGGMSSTPAPTPTPTPANYKKFDDLQGDQAFESVGVTTVLKVGGGDPTSISLEKRNVGQGLPVRYLVGPDRIAIDTSAGGTYTSLESLLRRNPSDFSRILASAPDSFNSRYPRESETAWRA